MLDTYNLSTPNGPYSVYCLYFPNGKMYIGITSKDPERRWLNGRGYDKQRVITRAINKYGWDHITKEVLMNGLTKEEAMNIEIDLIHRYNLTNHNYGYNTNAGGDLGPTLDSRITTNMLSLWNEGYTIKEIENITHHSSHTVSASIKKLGVTDEEIQERHVAKMIQSFQNYNSKIKHENQKRVVELWNKNYSPSEIANLINMRSSTVHKLLDDYGVDKSIRNNKTIEKLHLNNAKTTGGTPRAVCQYSLDGTYIATFNSIKEAAEQTGASSHSISAVCRRLDKRKSSGGFLWSYEIDHLEKMEPFKNSSWKAVEQYSEDGVYVATYHSLAEATKALNETDQSQISDALRGRIKTAYGFIWKYANIA